MISQSTPRKLSNAQIADRAWSTLVLMLKPFKEAYHCFKFSRMACIYCLAWGILMTLALVTKSDWWILNKVGYGFFRPTHSFLRFPYYFFVSFSGFYFYGCWRTAITQIVLNRLSDVFVAAGLKNNLGKLPSYMSDQPIDEFTRRMRLTRANLPKESFEKARGFIESGLHIFVDEIREDRLAGTVDILYSATPMPGGWEMMSVDTYKDWSFVIGKTRGKTITTDLRKTPHLLIAGQTGGGKSTFLRQFITTLYVNNPKTHFTLIDLKGGLEFQLFEKAKERVCVVGELDRALEKLARLESLLTRRMALIKAHGCKDIDSFLKKSPDLLKNTDESFGVSAMADRHVIVIDEAAEIFLTGPGSSSKDTQAARKMLSKISRLGRSVGVHLVFATQRPDSKTIDSQVKTNLPGIICFQMPNDASSITVLGNGRATDLPPVPGRAIWKSGSEQFEIQTPDISVKYVANIFGADDEIKPAPKASDKNKKDPNEDSALADLKDEKE